jgi:hypothetical protein
MAIKVEGTERIAQVATISANGETDVGNLLAKAMEKVTKDGVITIRKSQAIHIETFVAYARHDLVRFFTRACGTCISKVSHARPPDEL